MWQGRAWPLELDRSTRSRFTAPEEAEAALVVRESRHVIWTVAYGSNACPDRLVDKGLDLHGAVLLPATVPGYVRAWEARRTTSTGAVPLTLQRADAGFLDAWVLGLLPEDMAGLDATEGRGSNYLVGEVGPVAVADRWLLAPALAYGPTPDTRLLATQGRMCTYPEVDQVACGPLLDDPLGVHLHADPLVNPIADGWPETPLEDLDLFVYGTLQPGHERWPLIEDLVEVVGEASVPGTLTGTFFGWPAAQFAGAGRVHGTLLRPRDPASAVALYRQCDEVEDVPRLFRRVAVPVQSDEGEWWSAAYGWNDDQGDPPGLVADDGRWVP